MTIGEKPTKQDVIPCIDQLTRIQSELQDTVKDLAKSKKKYFETEQMAHTVREKADIEAKSKLSLFQSRISLQKASVKLKAKRSDCNSKATHARNEYLLTLAAANAHQDRYYQTDLMNTMKDLDGDIYDHVKDYLISFSRTELETCQSVHNTFQFLLETSSRVMQDFNQQLFLQENPVFHKAQVFHFQPSDSDMEPVIALQRKTQSVIKLWWVASYWFSSLGIFQDLSFRWSISYELTMLAGLDRVAQPCEPCDTVEHESNSAM
ncbi:UNVERIFIED_CONTAM: hypothetical protein FKN15_021758 [Acipenser sinensis]